MNSNNKENNGTKANISLIIDENKTINFKLDINIVTQKLLLALSDEICKKYNLDLSIKNKLYTQLEKNINEVRLKQYNKAIKDEQFNKFYYSSISRKLEFEKKIEEIRKDKLQKEVEDCTFTPKINELSTSIYNKKYKNDKERLYRLGRVDTTNSKKDIKNNESIDKRKWSTNKKSTDHIILTNSNKKYYNNLLNQTDSPSNIKNLTNSNSKNLLICKDISEKNIINSYSKNYVKKLICQNNNKSLNDNMNYDDRNLNVNNDILYNNTNNYSIGSLNKSNSSKPNLKININDKFNSIQNESSFNYYLYNKNDVNNNKQIVAYSPNLHYIKNKIVKSNYFNAKQNKVLNTEVNKSASYIKKVNSNPKPKIYKPNNNRMYNNYVNTSKSTSKNKNIKIKINQTDLSNNKSKNKNNVCNTINTSHNKGKVNINITKDQIKEAFYNRLYMSKKINKNKKTINEFKTLYEYSTCSKNKSKNKIDFKRNNNTFKTLSTPKQKCSANISYKANDDISYYDKRDEEELINNINSAKSEQENAKLIYFDQSNKSRQKYLENQIKNIFDLISEQYNGKNLNFLNNLNDIPEHIKKNVIVPTCLMIFNKNLEFNFSNFYLIASEIINNYLS